MCYVNNVEWSLVSHRVQNYNLLHFEEYSDQYCLLGGETVQQAEADHPGHLHQALHVPALQVDCVDHSTSISCRSFGQV